jgi:hypothetical protein
MPKSSFFPSKSCCLLVDHELKNTVGNPFKVPTSEDDVINLGEKVKGKRQIDLANIDAMRLTVCVANLRMAFITNYNDII